MKRRPISDLELYRAAHLLIERHGSDAVLVAEHRVDEMFDRGDVERLVVWRYILAAINELQRK